MDWTLGFQAQAAAAIVVFARLGTALMFLPGFGDLAVPQRHRLALGMILSLGLMQAVPVVLPDTPVLLTVLLAQEALVGLYLGLGARLFFMALHYLGGLIAFVSSLTNALAQGNQDYQGSTVVTTLLMVGGTALLFATDSHHLMIRGLFLSYDALPPALVPLSDMAHELAKLATRSLYIAMLIGAPFFVLSVLMNLGLGLANRIMPNMPIFMVAGPATIMLGLGLLYFVHEPMLRYFLDQFADFFLTFRP